MNILDYRYTDDCTPPIHSCIFLFYIVKMLKGTLNARVHVWYLPWLQMSACNSFKWYDILTLSYEAVECRSQVKILQFLFKNVQNFQN